MPANSDLASTYLNFLSVIVVLILYLGYKTLWPLWGRKKANELFELRKQNPVIKDDPNIESEKWEDMFEGAQGRAEELQDNIIANIKGKSIPDTMAEKRKGGYGKNIRCSVLCIENKYARYHQMILFALDYGEYLDIRWFYAFDKPDRMFNGGDHWIVRFLDYREQRRYEKMLESDGRHKLGFLNMERWKEMVNFVIKEEIKLMKEEEPKTGFHEQNKNARGFVNLS